MDDREDLGATMLFGSLEMEEIARLQPGEVFFFTEGYFGPRRLATPDIHAQFAFPVPPFGAGILPHIRNKPWFRKAAETRALAEMELLREGMDRFDSLRIELTRRTSRLAKSSAAKVGDTSEEAGRIAREASRLRRSLASALAAFIRDTYRPLIAGTESPECAPAAVVRKQLVERFESVTKPDSQSCMEILSRLARLNDHHPLGQGR